MNNIILILLIFSLMSYQNAQSISSPGTYEGLQSVNSNVYITRNLNRTFIFEDEITGQSNISSSVTATFREEYYAHEKKSYYFVSYKVVDYKDGEVYKGPDKLRSNPFYGIEGERLEFLMEGEPVLKNSFTEIMYKYLLMEDEELQIHTGRTTPQHYRKSIMLSIDNFWD